MQASRENAAIFKAIAGSDGVLNDAKEWSRLDAADGKSDGQFQLKGLSAEDRLVLGQASKGQAAVSIKWAADPQPIDWSNPAVQEAYGDFLKERWNAWKQNGEEADCKTLALRMMEDFRRHFADKAGIALADPIPAKLQGKWVQYTAAKPGPLPATVPAKARDDYSPHAGKPMISGPNHFYQHILADAVARHVTTEVKERDGKATIQPYQRKKPMPEGLAMFLDPHPAVGTRLVNPEALRPGDILFQNHPVGVRQTQDQRVDHTMHVISVERDPVSGKVSKLVIAMGTYDDLNDYNENTHPSIDRLNNYAFETAIEFDGDGDVADCHVTWQSDPFIQLESTDRTSRIKMAYGILGEGEYWIGVHRWK